MPKTPLSHHSILQKLTFFATPRGLLVIAVLLCVTPLQLFSFLILLAVAARALPFGALGILTRGLLSLGLSVCIITFIALAAWAINVPISSSAILLILALLLVGFISWQAPPTTTSFWRTDRYELTSAVLAIAAMLFVATPVLQAPNAASLLRVISAGGDNSSHIDMVKTSDLNQGIAYGKNNRVNPPGSAISYPQGWHFNVAFYKWLSDPLVHYKERPGKILLLFYVSALAWFGMLVFFITRLAFKLTETFQEKPRPLALFGPVAVVGGVTIHWLLQLFTHGFEAQTASLTLLVMEALILAAAFSRPAAKRYPLLIIAALLAVGCNFIWVFIMPITCGLAAAAVIITIFQLRKLPPWPMTATFTLLSGLALLQPLFYLIYPVQFDFPIILQRGAINPVFMVELLILFCLIAGYAMLRRKSKPLLVCVALASGGLLFSIGLMFYQLHELQELRYFYYKSTYTFIVIGAAIVGAIAYDIISQLLQIQSIRRSSIQVLIGLTIATTGLIWWQIKDPGMDAYLNGSLGGMGISASHAVIGQVTKGPAVSADTVFIGSCNRGDDIRASLFVSALTFDPIQRVHSFNPGAHDEKIVFEAIKAAMQEKERHITVIASDQVVLAHLKDFLGESFKDISIVSLDTTPETEPITQCPDRIRDIARFPVMQQ